MAGTEQFYPAMSTCFNVLSDDGSSSFNIGIDTNLLKTQDQVDQLSALCHYSIDLDSVDRSSRQNLKSTSESKGKLKS